MSGHCAFRTMEKDELQAISRRGGIASGKARREQRRKIEEKKIEDLVRMAVIRDGVYILKQMHKAMTPDELAKMDDYYSSEMSPRSSKAKPAEDRSWNQEERTI